MFKIKKQISKLYMASILGNLSLTGAWVAILAARGYSLIKIGIAETVFHIFSLTFEIPSGVFADVFGRKQMLVVSSIMRVIGSICMICSKNLTMVCVAIACFALSYNFSREQCICEELRGQIRTRYTQTDDRNHIVDESDVGFAVCTEVSAEAEMDTG